MQIRGFFRLRDIIKHARKATRVTVRDHKDLEDWVEDDGRLVLIGEAAHPFPVCPPADIYPPCF